MHNAAYAALGMNRTYAAFRVTPANLAAALRSIVPLGIVGVNLTVPHKQSAARLIKDLSGEARMLGAVNCVVNRRGVLRGDNTDARGLERDLRRCLAELDTKEPGAAYTRERLESMAGFFEAVTELYDQMKRLPTGTVRKLLRMGTKVRKKAG